MLGVLAFTAAAAAVLDAQVSFDRHLNPDREPHNWLMYSRTHTNQRHSPLTQITPANVKSLELKWVWQARSLEKYETTSLVVDGVLYTVQAPNDVFALDAATGRIFWSYSHTPSENARPCCGRVNRGVAILGDRLYMGTIDAHLLALDARSGHLVWKVRVADVDQNYAITHAPVIVKDLVIVGTAGGDFPTRGMITAYDAKTGKERWRFYTIPGPGEPGNDTWSGESWKTGGAAVWNSAAYDPETNLTYWGTGNPWPDWDGRQRLGDNLYSDSVVALDADTGRLRWHYQFTPHDEVDYDSTQVPVLADIDWQGKPRKAMIWANRNGVAYLIDRTTGEVLNAKPYVQVNWLKGFNKANNWRPIREPRIVPSPEGTTVMPTVLGATNWQPPSFSPRTGLFYVSVWEGTSIVAVEGATPRGIATNRLSQAHLESNRRTPQEGYGALRAIDPKTLDMKWEFKMSDTTWAGVLTTASDLVLSGGKEGYFYALDARNGSLLWRIPLGGQVNNGPMTYAVDGRQYVAIAAGSALFAFGLPDPR
jgi:alcohol dehydrogenase (cytochrome c)